MRNLRIQRARSVSPESTIFEKSVSTTPRPGIRGFPATPYFSIILSVSVPVANRSRLATQIPPKQVPIGVKIRMTEQKATNVTWHAHRITREDRQKLNGHRGAVLWFTGLSGCGKSTIANAVDQLLHERGVHTFVLDGDNIRMGLNKNLGFSPADRTENIRRIGEVSKLFADAATIVSTAFISPYKADRDMVRALLPEGEFIEILVQASLETCESRDPKGLYKKARAGEIKDFTGISAPYESPEKPEIVLDSDNKGIEELAREVIAYLVTKGILPA